MCKYLHRNKKHENQDILQKIPTPLTTEFRDIETGRISGENFKVFYRKDQWLERDYKEADEFSLAPREENERNRGKCQVSGWKKCMN